MKNNNATITALLCFALGIFSLCPEISIACKSRVDFPSFSADEINSYSPIYVSPHIKL